MIADIASIAARSPFRVGPAFSAAADAEELRFREEIEPYPDPERDIADGLVREELVAKLDYALERIGLAPSGTVVELGAGVCWLSSALARRPAVDRVIAVEFSRRRLEELAPIAMAILGAPPEKIERVLADFHDPGLDRACVDIVFTDSSFHHSADPARLAQVAFELLRPGGSVVLFREPTLALLRRTRDHGLEGEHGDFEHEYFARGYLGFLEDAGFEAHKTPASGGFTTTKARAILRPPLSWLNGIAFTEFTYAGRKPD